MIEIAKLLAAVLFGGVGAALITEWFRRRREKVQRVQLIERVNRVVTALDGFTVARPSGPGGALVEVKDLREYQLTMRNSTSTHLVDVEVEFQFPASDVQALASLPTMSRTPLVLKPVNAIKGATGFRWAIPNFPTGDSVEFTFRAVAAPSDRYEVALYNVGVVIEKIIGEPPPPKKGPSPVQFVGFLTGATTFVLLLVFLLQRYTQHSSGEKLTVVSQAGCSLQVVSIFEVYGRWLDSPWHVKHRIINVGPKDCIVQSQAMNLENPTVIKPGEVLDRELILQNAPKQQDAPMSLGTAQSPRETANITVYVAR
jgi:hypothetical protein